jgi:hypothetical protein
MNHCGTGWKEKGKQEKKEKGEKIKKKRKEKGKKKGKEKREIKRNYFIYFLEIMIHKFYFVYYYYYIIKNKIC